MIHDSSDEWNRLRNGDYNESSKLSHPNYEYDVHSLVKAFYAEDQGTVITRRQNRRSWQSWNRRSVWKSNWPETGAEDPCGRRGFSVGCRDRKPCRWAQNGPKRFLYRTLSKVTGQKLPWETYRHPSHEDRLRYAG